MKISLVICAHNEEQRIGHCLASIQSALKAYPCNAEVVVVANACTDETAAIARGYPGVRVVVEPRKGLSRARQTGYENSTGDLIANLDADIIMPDAWLPFVMNTFVKEPKLVALSGPYIYYDLSLFARACVKFFYGLSYIAYIITRFVLRAGSVLQGGNYVARRSALMEVGGYDTSIHFYGEDTEAARRLSKVGPVRWTFRLPMYTSGRRLAHEGLVHMGMKYAINFVWTTFAAKPYTKTHIDVRTPVRSRKK